MLGIKLLKNELWQHVKTSADDRIEEQVEDQVYDLVEQDFWVVDRQVYEQVWWQVSEEVKDQRAGEIE